jgi:transcriptional regulator with XRE-family HTH domain
LSEKVGISAKYLSSIERGKGNPPLVQTGDNRAWFGHSGPYPLDQIKRRSIASRLSPVRLPGFGEDIPFPRSAR